MAQIPNITSEHATAILKNSKPCGLGGIIVAIKGLSDPHEGPLYAKSEPTYDGKTSEEFKAAGGSPDEWMRYGDRVGVKVSELLTIPHVNKLMGDLDWRKLIDTDNRKAFAGLKYIGHAYEQEGNAGPRVVEIHFRKKNL